MENQTTELVKINPEEYGLQKNEAQQIAAFFTPMLDKMKELEAEFNEVVNMPLEPSTFAKAKELRLKYVKVRTGTAEIHKKAKDYYLKGGRFVDGWKNTQAIASHGKEEALEKIEKYYEIQEAERKAKLKAERLLLIDGLCENPEMYPLAEMSEHAFLQLLEGFKLAKQQREDAERRAEEDRIAKEKAEAEERERIRLENERLKKEAEEKEKQLKKEREEAEKKQAELKAKQEAELKKQREESDRLAKIEAEKQAKIQAELKAKADAERKEKERIEAELKAKQEAEIAEQKRKEQEEKDRIEAEKKAAKAPKKQKLNNWVDDMIIGYPAGMVDDKTVIEIIAKFESFKKWAKSEIEKL